MVYDPTEVIPGDTQTRRGPNSGSLASASK